MWFCGIVCAGARLYSIACVSGGKEIKDLIFITGNQHKADYLAKWLGIAVPHQKVDLEELQSLDLEAVVRHKARAAYDLVGKPVLVEDIALTFHAMGQLPGTFIKWFLQELAPAGLAKMATAFEDKTATASIMYGLYDGVSLHIFEAHVPGSIASEPRVSDASGWKNASSWNSIFIPDGSAQTYGEMSDEELKPFSHRAKAIEKLAEYLHANP